MISKSRRARGSRGSTKSVFTVNLTTAHLAKSRWSILSQIKPRWREISKLGNLQETQAGSYGYSVLLQICHNLRIGHVEPQFGFA